MAGCSITSVRKFKNIIFYNITLLLMIDRKKKLLVTQGVLFVWTAPYSLSHLDKCDIKKIFVQVIWNVPDIFCLSWSVVSNGFRGLQVVHCDFVKGIITITSFRKNLTLLALFWVEKVIKVHYEKYLLLFKITKLGHAQKNLDTLCDRQFHLEIGVTEHLNTFAGPFKVYSAIFSNNSKCIDHKTIKKVYTWFWNLI